MLMMLSARQPHMLCTKQTIMVDAVREVVSTQGVPTVTCTWLTQQLPRPLLSPSCLQMQSLQPSTDHSHAQWRRLPPHHHKVGSQFGHTLRACMSRVFFSLFDSCRVLSCHVLLQSAALALCAVLQA